MNQEELLALVKRKAGSFSEEAAQRPGTFMEVGFAVRIPNDVGTEVREHVDQELRNLRWNFARVPVGFREYYVLFPLG